MSILIKGMEMPKRCLDCPFLITRDNDDCILQSDETNAKFEGWDDMKASCPLIELPPHGRLIDADAIQDYNVETFGQRLLIIDTAPTVIEAED